QSLDRIGEVSMPHSLGMLYETVTEYLGFLRSSDEYKVMALASFGKPAYMKEFREIVQLSGGGSYAIHPLRLEERLGPRRLRGEAVEQRHLDIAHSLQQVLEETGVELVRWLAKETGEENFCFAGGVALNCVLNSRLRDSKAFKKLWVQPASGDAGTALGAAVWLDAMEQKTAARPFRMDHAFLGPAFDEKEIESFLRWSKLSYRRTTNLADEAAALLAEGRVIGWFQRGMEFGPRALGGRSILASPIPEDMQARLNEIKDREDFRPVAPVVLEEDAHEWFEEAHEAPFMLFIFKVREEKAAQIPAVRHVDGTARVQTIRRDQNAEYYELLQAFKRRTGVGVLVNTSFNTRGEPVVCTPRDAIESFLTSPLDALVIGPFILEKAAIITPSAA
ncbi:MAG: carbamoyltransferase, partial [Verrucomicrobiaceae bacterium]|nr:carbamoyltransferase [Verrucomicrobiaceae bacterium]